MLHCILNQAIGLWEERATGDMMEIPFFSKLKLLNSLLKNRGLLSISNLHGFNEQKSGASSSE